MPLCSRLHIQTDLEFITILKESIRLKRTMLQLWPMIKILPRPAGLAICFRTLSSLKIFGGFPLQHLIKEPPHRFKQPSEGLRGSQYRLAPSGVCASYSAKKKGA